MHGSRDARGKIAAEEVAVVACWMSVGHRRFERWPVPELLKRRFVMVVVQGLEIAEGEMRLDVANCGWRTVECFR